VISVINVEGAIGIKSSSKNWKKKANWYKRS